VWNVILSSLGLLSFCCDFSFLGEVGSEVVEVVGSEDSKVSSGQLSARQRHEDLCFDLQGIDISCEKGRDHKQERIGSSAAQ